jgi:hypothetical protein
MYICIVGVLGAINTRAMKTTLEANETPQHANMNILAILTTR